MKIDIWRGGSRSRKAGRQCLSVLPQCSSSTLPVTACLYIANSLFSQLLPSLTSYQDEWMYRLFGKFRFSMIKWMNYWLEEKVEWRSENAEKWLNVGGLTLLANLPTCLPAYVEFFHSPARALGEVIIIFIDVVNCSRQRVFERVVYPQLSSYPFLMSVFLLKLLLIYLSFPSR